MIPSIGYAVREGEQKNLDSIGRGLENTSVDAVEIELESAAGGLRVPRRASAREFEVVSVHALNPCLADPQPLRRDDLQALKAVALETGARSVSDRLNLPRFQGAPKRKSSAPPGVRRPGVKKRLLESTRRRIERMQKHFGSVRFDLETASDPETPSGAVGPPGATGPAAAMREAEYLARLLTETGCGWLLDVARIHVDALNAGSSAYDYLEQVLPAASRLQMRISGISYDPRSKQYAKDPSRPVPEAVFELYAFVLEAAFEKVDAIFFQRDWRPGSETRCRREMRTIREIAQGVAGIYAPAAESGRELEMPVTSTL